MIPQLTKKVQHVYAYDVEGQTRKAVTLFEECSEAGSSVAMDALGHIFFRGDGVEVGHARGIHWWQRCVDKGADRRWDTAWYAAHGGLGQAYRHGIGVLQDSLNALENLKIAAEVPLREGPTGNSGLSVSMNNYAHLLSVCSRHEEAVYWFRKEAELDYPLAMTNLARHLLHGQGSARDLQAAEKWLLKAEKL